MTDAAEKTKPGLRARLREVRQRRAWRRERRKGSVGADAVTIQRQQHLDGRTQRDHVGPTTDGGASGGV